MLDAVRARIPDTKRLKTLFDLRNVGLYLFTLLVLSVTWSSARVLQRNYELQKKVAILEQKNQVAELENKTIELRNRYLKSNEYVELEARRQTGNGLPGEQAIIIPKDVALTYTVPSLEPEPTANPAAAVSTRPWYAQNIRDWFDFFRGQLQVTE